MQRSEAWTRLAPYKEQEHFRGASDSIANAYSPTAQHLRAKELTP
jgi:dynein heavy chain